MPKMTEIAVYAADLPELRDMLAQLRDERDRARSIAVELEAQLETALRDLDAARAEIARLSASEASTAAAARQDTGGLR